MEATGDEEVVWENEKCVLAEPTMDPAEKETAKIKNGKYFDRVEK